MIFIILLQSCSGGRIGNFLESSFYDLERISQDEFLQKDLINKKNLVNENNETINKNFEKLKKVEKPKKVIENKKNLVNENNETINKNFEKVKKVEKPEKVIKNSKDKNLEKFKKQKNSKIKNLTNKGKGKLQSYKIIFILKNVDPKDPTKDLSTILRNSEVNFEIEKIERILDSKNKIMNKN